MSGDPTGPAADWCAAVADVVADTAVRVGGLAGRIAEDWLDDHGREWAERTALLHRDLHRTAQAAAELGDLLARRHPDADPAGGVPPPPAAGRRSARLGSLDGTRADDGQGMRIAEIPPP